LSRLCVMYVVLPAADGDIKIGDSSQYIFSGAWLGVCDKSNTTSGKGGKIVFSKTMTASTKCTLAILTIDDLRTTLEAHGNAEMFGMKDIKKGAVLWGGLKSKLRSQALLKKLGAQSVADPVVDAEDDDDDDDDNFDADAVVDATLLRDMHKNLKEELSADLNANRINDAKLGALQTQMNLIMKQQQQQQKLLEILVAGQQGKQIPVIATISTAAADDASGKVQEAEEKHKEQRALELQNSSMQHARSPTSSTIVVQTSAPDQMDRQERERLKNKYLMTSHSSMSTVEI